MQLMFRYSFPQAQRLYAITLKKDIHPPTYQTPRAPGHDSDDSDSTEYVYLGYGAKLTTNRDSDSDSEDSGPIEIHFHNIKVRPDNFVALTAK